MRFEKENIAASKNITKELYRNNPEKIQKNFFGESKIDGPKVNNGIDFEKMMIKDSEEMSAMFLEGLKKFIIICKSKGMTDEMILEEYRAIQDDITREYLSALDIKIKGETGKKIK